MKLYQSSSTYKPFLSIVACQHGNEPFDREILEELGLYPVLLKDPSYMGNQGLKATKKIQMSI